MSTWSGWPPQSNLRFYSRGVPLTAMYAGDEQLDLSDTLMLHWPHAQRTVEMRLNTLSDEWAVWDERNLAKIESNVRYDLGYDAYRVTITRLSGQNEACSTDMIWKLVIRLA